MKDLQISPLLTISGDNRYSVMQIQELLSRMPQTIREYGERCAEAMTDVDMKKYELKKSRAIIMLEASTNKEALGLSSEKDRVAYVDQSEVVVMAEIDLITAKGNYEGLKLKYEQAENTFVAVRKLASMIQADEENQKLYDKYRDPNNC